MVGGGGPRRRVAHPTSDPPIDAGRFEMARCHRRCRGRMSRSMSPDDVTVGDTPTPARNRPAGETIGSKIPPEREERQLDRPTGSREPRPWPVHAQRHRSAQLRTRIRSPLRSDAPWHTHQHERGGVRGAAGGGVTRPTQSMHRRLTATEIPHRRWRQTSTVGWARMSATEIARPRRDPMQPRATDQVGESVTLK
jgi:hypothetical protein